VGGGGGGGGGKGCLPTPLKGRKNPHWNNHRQVRGKEGKTPDFKRRERVKGK